MDTLDRHGQMERIIAEHARSQPRRDAFMTQIAVAMREDTNVLIVAEPDMGTTATLRKITAEIGFNWIQMLLSQYGGNDLEQHFLGSITDFDATAQAFERAADGLDEDSAAVLFLDGYDRCVEAVRAIVSGLVAHRTVGTRRFPHLTPIVVACNERPSDQECALFDSIIEF